MQILGLTVTLTEKERENLEGFVTSGAPGGNFVFCAISGDDHHVVIDRQDGTFLAMYLVYAGEGDEGLQYEVIFNRLFDKRFNATVSVIQEMLLTNKEYQEVENDE